MYIEMTPRYLAGFIAVGSHRFSRLTRGSHPPSSPVSGASFHAGLVSPPTGLPGLPVSSSGVLLGHIGGGGHNEGWGTATTGNRCWKCTSYSTLLSLCGFLTYSWLKIFSKNNKLDLSYFNLIITYELRMILQNIWNRVVDNVLNIPHVHKSTFSCKIWSTLSSCLWPLCALMG